MSSTRTPHTESPSVSASASGTSPTAKSEATPASNLPADLDQHPGQKRVLIEGIKPQLDGGRFAVKRVVGDKFTVEVDIFVDGHDRIAAHLLSKHESEEAWTRTPLKFHENDHWSAAVTLKDLGRYQYTVEAWVEHFVTWRQDLRKRVDAGQDVSVDLLIGADLVADAARRATGADKDVLAEWVRKLKADEAKSHVEAILTSEELGSLMETHANLDNATRHEVVYEVIVDRERARFSSWYEFFPRSTSPDPDRHGTFDDCIMRLPYVAEMGFDVIYLPPIHPIGDVFRKGKNNSTVAQPGDLGSPWAIGNAKQGENGGGHKDVHPELGTLKGFEKFVREANRHGIEIALDVALQCSPDHPYVTEHPEWFKQRPDGTIQYAENPPKKYQDIYPFDFETGDWKAMWEELTSIFTFWMDRGVRIFRVDNPHTKSFPFWEWCIAQLKQKDPGVILLAEAFTRPRVMQRLAKLGYTQSYTYFTWRNSKEGLTEYMTELTQTALAEYFRPNFWPNTPDILHEYLQTGGRPAFMTRLVLAATMTANYGMYGPAYELCYGTPVKQGSEEYLDSEKYQQVSYNLDDPGSLRDFIGSVNQIRREYGCLQRNDTIKFHPIDNEQMLCYSKSNPDDPSEILVMIVSLDPYHTQAGWVELPLADFGFEPGMSYQAHDLLTDSRYLWQGPRNYVELNPHVVPAHILRLRKRVRTERDFEYFL